MTRIWHHLICCLILAWSFDARGYEILTHEQVLTRQAANQLVWAREKHHGHNSEISKFESTGPHSSGIARRWFPV